MRIAQERQANDAGFGGNQGIVLVESGFGEPQAGDVKEIKMLTRIVAIVCLASGLATVSVAQKKKMAAPTCPICHMSLSSKKTKSNTKAVKFNGKTYYCCAGCKMKK